MPRAEAVGWRAEDLDQKLEAAEWVEALTGQGVDPSALGDELRSGVVLCEVANAIEAGSIKRISHSALPFKQMDNISAFTAFCRRVGVPARDCFDTVDLFEGRDLDAVVQTLHTLGSYVQQTRPNLPKLGPRLAEANRRRFSSAQLLEARAAVRVTARPTSFGETFRKTASRRRDERVADEARPRDRRRRDAAAMLQASCRDDAAMLPR